MLHLLKDSEHFTEHVMGVLHKKTRNQDLFPERVSDALTASAVLFLLGEYRHEKRKTPSEPCLVFNKRSTEVRQPGDLCFPGGRIAPRLDGCLSRILGFPLFPLARWPFWTLWREERGPQARRLALLFATSLRESLEEMRLNPLGVRFLGPMPPQNLRMFTRVIYPMTGWIKQKRFYPNWEVEKIVHVPITDLLDPNRYACYRLTMETGPENEHHGKTQDFPCYRHEKGDQKEILWGATYRMVMAFLELVFGFRPPPIHTLPVIYGSLNDRYFNRGG